MEIVKRKGISCSLLIQMCYYSFVGNNVALLGKHEMELDVIQLPTIGLSQVNWNSYTKRCIFLYLLQYYS